MAHDFDKLLHAAWHAASAAGAIICDHWQEPKQIAHKGAIDLVTTIDRASERCIVETLHGLFPEHSILAEEETNWQGSQHSYRWIVDPIDGTTNFAHGYPQFCVSIGLEYNAEIILGLVYDPLRRECFRATKGHGARLNDVPIRVSAVQQLDKALLATGFPYDQRQNADFYLTFFKAFMTRCQGIRRNGSAALDLCYVACGRLEGFWELKLKPWDVAAGCLIVTEAGGQMSDFAGDLFSINGNQTLATNGLIHNEMLNALRGLQG